MKRAALRILLAIVALALAPTIAVTACGGSEPDPEGYPVEFRREFLDQCEAQDPEAVETCECTYGWLEENVPLKELIVQMNRSAEDLTETLTDWLDDALADCRVRQVQGSHQALSILNASGASSRGRPARIPGSSRHCGGPASRFDFITQGQGLRSDAIAIPHRWPPPSTSAHLQRRLGGLLPGLPALPGRTARVLLTSRRVPCRIGRI